MNLDRIGATYRPYLLSLFRFIVGLSLFQFGVAKLFKFPHVPMFEEVTPLSLFGVAGMFELVLGGMLMLGLFDPACRLRPVRRNGVRVFHRTFSAGLFSAAQRRNAGDHVLLRCLYLACAGGGPWSMDAMMRNKG